MTTDWYYINGGQQHGPVSSEQLRQLAASGQLASDDLVWKEGMDDWVPASKAKGLNAVPPKPASVPPPIPAPPPSPPPPPQKGTRGPLEAAKTGLAGLTFDWKNWDVGGKTIFLAACAAVLSMVTNWVQLGPISANGFSQGTFLFLGVFVYPVLMLLRQRPIHRKAGSACAVGGVVLALGYIASKSGNVFGQFVILAGAGPVVFLLASVALLVGILKYASRHGSLAAPTDPATDVVNEALRGIGGKLRAAAKSERTKAAGEKVKSVATKAAAGVDQFVHSEAVQSRIAAAKTKWLGLTTQQRLAVASAAGILIVGMLFWAFHGESPDEAFQQIIAYAEDGQWGEVWDRIDKRSQAQMESYLKMFASMAGSLAKDDSSAHELQSLSGKDLFVRIASERRLLDEKYLHATIESVELDGDRASLHVAMPGKNGSELHETVLMLYEDGIWKFDMIGTSETGSQDSSFSGETEAQPHSTNSSQELTAGVDSGNAAQASIAPTTTDAFLERLAVLAAGTLDKRYLGPEGGSQRYAVFLRPKFSPNDILPSPEPSHALPYGSFITALGEPDVVDDPYWTYRLSDGTVRISVLYLHQGTHLPTARYIPKSEIEGIFVMGNDITLLKD